MLYFLPGNQSPDKSLIAKFGLEYAFEDLPLEYGQVRPNQGPDNQSGFIVSCSGHASDYRPDAQVWHKHPLGAYFGWNKATPPKPEQLQRANMLEGKPVRLVDGNDWIIPIAHSWVIEDQSIRYTEEFARTLEFVDGAWRPGKVIPSHEAFANIGKVVFDAFRNGIDGKFAIDNAPDLCCKTICLNYRLSAVEVSALGLLSNATSYAWKILRTVIDLDGYLELQKKVSADPSTSSGSAAVIHDTA